jgi:hypothetical protein
VTTRIRFLVVVCVVLFALVLLPVEQADAISGVVHSTNQGFDNCQTQPAAFYDDWYLNSAFYNFLTYLGGTNTNCDGGYQSVAWYSHNVSHHWGLYLVWAGRQSVCDYPNFNDYISSNTSTAYSQGQSAGQYALQQAIAYGFAAPNIITFDLEGYPDQGNCRDAASSYISGWDKYLEDHNIYPAVYGSSGASYLADFKSISYPPDLVHAGDVASPPNSNVNHIDYLGDTAWQHSRHKQWNVSAHSVTYGTHTLTGPPGQPAFDFDCNDGYVNPGGASTINDSICGN